MTKTDDYQNIQVGIELKDSLEDFFLESCPFKTFEKWYAMAEKTEANVDAMSVATVDVLGVPRNRFLLFKGLMNSQFVFYTNYLSQKAQDIDQNPHVSLNFFWSTVKFQVRITGVAHRSSREFSRDYFRSRDRDSQLASAISRQSSAISSRKELLEKLGEFKLLLNNKEVDCPEHWGGYLLTPTEFEFFIYGEHRINDRFLFKKNESNWNLQRLQP
jgi:pyridoxamine 5'-phosphate oxidase